MDDFDMFEKLKKVVKDLYALEADATEEGVKKRGKLLKDLEKKLSKLREQLAEDELDAESRRKVQLELELSRLRKEKMFKNLDEESKYKEARDKELLVEEQALRIKQEQEIAKVLSKQQREKIEHITDTQKAALEAIEKAKADAQAAKDEADPKKKKKLEKEAKKSQDLVDILGNIAKRQEAVDMNKGNPLQEMLKQVKEDAMFAKTAEGKKQRRDEQLAKTMKTVGKAIKDAANQINSAIEAYSKAQIFVNARLQGSTVGSFSKVTKELSEVAFSPLIKTEDLYENVKSLVQSGVAQNVSQRAFFQTVKSGIAETFDATESYMKRIIRIQQNDSTAARLGMEAYLTRWLNAYVENTEYLTTTFDSVANSLLEASAVIGAGGKAGASLEFEAVVQNWLGAMTGVGFSESSAQAIADALGQLGSGNLDVLNSDIGTLLTLAAASTGQNIGEMLVEGLDATKTNELLESAVLYLQTIANGNSNNVTKAEMAKIFGVSMSDLVSIASIDTTKITASTKEFTYEAMYKELGDQLKALPGRMGISNILGNALNNFTYQTGMSIAGNAVTRALWDITDLIQSVTDGINIPAISVMGNMLDLETTVENLVKLDIVGVSALANTGKIIKGAASVLNGSNLLKYIGANAENANYSVNLLNKDKKPTRDLTTGQRQSSIETSEAGSLKSNSSSEDIQTALVNDAENAQKAKKDKLRKEAEDNDPVLRYLSKTVKLQSILKGIYFRLGGALNSNGEIDTSSIVGSGASSPTSSLNTEANVATILNNIYDKTAELGSVVVPMAAEINSSDNTLTSIAGTLTDIRDILNKSIGTEGKVIANTTIATSSVNLVMSMASMSDVSNNAVFQSIIAATSNNNPNTVGVAGQNTATTTINKTTDYLDDIQFGDGFKQLVNDVSEIKTKLSDIATANSGTKTTGNIDSFNTGNFLPQQSMIL